MVRATALTVGDHAGGEKMVLEPPLNSARRRKLGDITNLQNQNKLVNQGAKQQQQAILVSSKENVENLQKENMRLMKVVVERDGIKSELQKLRIDFQKVKEQNLLLAQANTRILAEFNTSKDQLEVLQHKLGCKNGLVMARKILLKEQTLPCTRHASKVKPNDADHENVSASESSNANSLQINEKANNKRRVSGRTNPAALDIIGRPGETCQTGDNIDNKKLVSDGNNAADKNEFVLDAEDHINDNVQSKRCCAGRQSASYKNIEIGQSKNLQKAVDAKEIKEDARFPLRRRSAQLKSQEPEPSESFHESVETSSDHNDGDNEHSGEVNLDATQEASSSQTPPLRRSTRKIFSPVVWNIGPEHWKNTRMHYNNMARLKSQEPEPSESFHESIETARRRRSTMFNIQELGVIQNLNGLHDDQEVVAKAGFVEAERVLSFSNLILNQVHLCHLRFIFFLHGCHFRCSASRQSIGSRPEAGEPHDTKEITGKSRVSFRRQSARFNFQELGVTENLNGQHDDQAIAAIAGCSASEQSMGSKPEAVEPHDMTETTRESRVSSRRQSANVKTQRAIKETADPPLHDDIVDESSPVSCTVSMEVRKSKNKPTGDESEEMRNTTIGRPSRQAAEKIKSYKEPSLKEKMRGDF